MGEALLPSPSVAQHSRPAQPRRNWPRRLLIGVNIFLIVCIVAVGGSLAYLKIQFGRISTIDLRNALRNGGDDDPGEPMNVLIVGSDTRANLSEEDEGKFNDENNPVGGQRSDTIILAHVDPRQEKAAILSIPRDLYVELPSGKNGRINQAFADGPADLIETIDKNLGIEIDHYVQVDFNGFRGIVNSIGGVTVYLPGPVRDSKSGLRMDRGGCVELNGEVALAYVRSRNFQYFESGTWRSDPTGDLGRIQRQQDFMRRVMRKAISRGIRNPITANRLVGAAIENVVIDDALSTKDIARLGKRFRSLEPEAVEMMTVPTEGARINGASVLRLKQPDTNDVINRFLGIEPPTDGPPPDIPPASVRVRVLNGSGKAGHATEVATALTKAGFSVADKGDARTFGAAQPVITYGSGQKAKAELLKAYLVGGTAQLVSDPKLTGVDVVITTGTNLTGVKTSPTAAEPETTSTTAGNQAEPSGTPQKPAC